MAQANQADNGDALADNIQEGADDVTPFRCTRKKCLKVMDVTYFVTLRTACQHKFCSHCKDVFIRGKQNWTCSECKTVLTNQEWESGEFSEAERRRRFACPNQQYNRCEYEGTLTDLKVHFEECNRTEMSALRSQVEELRIENLSLTEDNSRMRTHLADVQALGARIEDTMNQTR